MRRSMVFLACALLLGAAACSSQATSGSTSNTSTSTGNIGVSNSTPSRAILTFDWLGGNSTIIKVYPGAADTPADRVSNGAFANGQTATIVCKTLGRWVSSVPPEKAKRSNVWYEIQTGGKTYYATAVYGDVSGGPVQWCPGM